MYTKTTLTDLDLTILILLGMKVYKLYYTSSNNHLNMVGFIL